MNGKDLIAHESLKSIPKILTLLDRNLHSPSYGCFDRNYWHYKIIDFPSGMCQEFVLPLALAYSLKIKANPYYRLEVLKEYVKAGIYFGIKSSHKDGSCDDYFPYEKASGAAAFSLLAFIESFEILNLNDKKIIDFFVLRANWLSKNLESGRLSNHQGLIALCLAKLSKILCTNIWDSYIDDKVNLILEWQNEEGWYPEYEGCDLGYQTLTISSLACLHEIRPSAKIKKSLDLAFDFSKKFMHEDGTMGGEYSSRNTFNYFPLGFEIIGKWNIEALCLNNSFIDGLRNGFINCYSDDHIIGHHTWNYLLSWKYFVDDRPKHTFKLQNGKYLNKNAALYIINSGNCQLYSALNKGGVFKFYRNSRLIFSDTQISLIVKNNKNAVAHLINTYEYTTFDNGFTVSGTFHWVKKNKMTTNKLLILRVGMMLIGKYFPNVIRKILQKLLITGKTAAPFSFKRSVSLVDSKLHINDTIFSKNLKDITDIKIGTNQTSIYVVMSRVFNKNQLTGWVDGNRFIKNFEETELSLSRVL